MSNKILKKLEDAANVVHENSKQFFERAKLFDGRLIDGEELIKRLIEFDEFLSEKVEQLEIQLNTEENVDFEQKLAELEELINSKSQESIDPYDDSEVKAEIQELAEAVEIRIVNLGNWLDERVKFLESGTDRQRLEELEQGLIELDSMIVETLDASLQETKKAVEDEIEEVLEFYDNNASLWMQILTDIVKAEAEEKKQELDEIANDEIEEIRESLDLFESDYLEEITELRILSSGIQEELDNLEADLEERFENKLTGMNADPFLIKKITDFVAQEVWTRESLIRAEYENLDHMINNVWMDEWNLVVNQFNDMKSQFDAMKASQEANNE